MRDPKPRLPWRSRAMAATTQSQFGAILAAVLKADIPPPYFAGSASITSDGFIMCDFVARDGRKHMGAFVGAVADLERNTAGLIKHLDLTDGEAAEMRQALQRWIGKDWRSKPGLFQG